MSRQHVTKSFDDQQRERIDQIMRRVRGVKFVAQPDAADQLGLSSDQRAEIEEILHQTRRKLNNLRHQDPSDAAPMGANPLSRQVREDQQREIFAELSAAQRKLFVAMVGPRFDLAKLGQVSFKAPELLESGGWINTQPLKLADLSGQVIALHFFACA